MIDKINGATSRAVWFNADAATERFYELLGDNRLCSTRCDGCSHVPFPPREFCPACGAADVTWIDLPRTGTLHAFTYQARGFRFVKPDVLGLVELDGVSGFVFARIAGTTDDLVIGAGVELDVLDIDERLRVPIFKQV